VVFAPGFAEAFSAAPVPASFAKAAVRSAYETMAYRSKTVRVRCPGERHRHAPGYAALDHVANLAAPEVVRHAARDTGASLLGTVHH